MRLRYRRRMSDSIRVLMLLVGAGAMAACSHAVRTTVDFRSVDAPETKHYELRDEESFAIPTPVDHLPPEYPVAMIGQHIAHVVVRTKVIVDEKGNVTEARFSDASLPAFDDAVRTAVSKWHYTPFIVRRWKDVTDAEGNVTDSRIASEEAKPFSLDYDFTFDLRDGKPVVVSNPQVTK